MYLVIVGSAFAFTLLFKHQLNAYDLNGDGLLKRRTIASATVQTVTINAYPYITPSTSLIVIKVYAKVE